MPWRCRAGRSGATSTTDLPTSAEAFESRRWPTARAGRSSHEPGPERGRYRCQPLQSGGGARGRAVVQQHFRRPVDRRPGSRPATTRPTSSRPGCSAPTGAHCAPSGSATSPRRPRPSAKPTARSASASRRPTRRSATSTRRRCTRGSSRPGRGSPVATTRSDTLDLRSRPGRRGYTALRDYLRSVQRRWARASPWGDYPGGDYPDRVIERGGPEVGHAECRAAQDAV